MQTDKIQRQYDRDGGNWIEFAAVTRRRWCCGMMQNAAAAAAITVGLREIDFCDASHVACDYWLAIV